MNAEEIIGTTKNWIERVVIGLNFCPFASKEFRNNSIHYHVMTTGDREECLKQFFKECERMDQDEKIETTLLIIPHGFDNFMDYLDLVEMAEQLIAVHDYEGVYQVATFHPQYLFAGSDENDPANYTNRSPYPILQLLREESIEKALEKFPNPERIPERNVEFARSKGVEFFRQLLVGS